MTARFIEVHSGHGRLGPMLLNVDQIEQVVEHEDGCIVFFIGEGAEGNILLAESLSEMRQLLNGGAS